MNCMRRVGLAIVLATLVFVFPSVSGADEFKLIPSIAVREEYNDNILYSPHDEEDDWITTKRGKEIGGIEKKGQYGQFIIWPEDIAKHLTE